MIYPRKWIRWRPGFLIPVFFLSSCQVAGQTYWKDAETLALGRCYVTRSGTGSAGLNQAGLGRTGRNTFSLHHLRPFITPDLDIVSLSAQLSLKRGGPGLMLSTMGITGMRQTSAWFSYGLMLHPRLYAGAGVDLRNTTTREDGRYHPEAGFALGLQFRIDDHLILGAHVSHPAAWSDSHNGPASELLMISSGLSYLFYQTARFYSELHIRTGQPVQWCNGLEIIVSDSLRLLLGMTNQPWVLSSGLSLKHRRLEIYLTVTYCMDTGTTPSTTLSYGW